MTAKTTTPNPINQMTDLMASWQQMGLGSLNAFGAGWIEKMSEMGSEWLHFLSDRVTEDVKFQHALLQAKNPAEIQKIQADFLKKAMDDYAAETGKMLAMGTKLFDPA